MLQISGVPGSVFFFRAGSVLAGRSFCQISSGVSVTLDGVAQALGHLGVAVEPHDPLGRGEQRLGLREDRARGREPRRPPAGDLARKLEVLHLVLAHRHQVGAIEQDVGRHQDRIVEQARRDALQVLRLIFELRHALELAQRRDGIEQPHQRRMLRHVRLHEERHARGIDAGAEQSHRHVAGALRQPCGIVAAPVIACRSTTQ